MDLEVTITKYPEHGTVTCDSMGLYRLVSPVSGATLVTTDPNELMRDPVSGAHLMVQAGKVVVVNPAEYQKFNRNREFYAFREPDVTMQTLRKTTKVTKCTNEKIGTAGTVTGAEEESYAETLARTMAKPRTGTAHEEPLSIQGSQIDAAKPPPAQAAEAPKSDAAASQ
ncbi:unnamed protein product [Pedinophyceae sp. YPF-701]|nr:unnamed protein product [Pedinophyceae sp. YPF-701]